MVVNSTTKAGVWSVIALVAGAVVALMGVAWFVWWFVETFLIFELK